SDRFNFEPEITAKIIKAGYKIIELPVSYTGRSYKDGKKIGLKDGLEAILTLIKYRFK
ncbi:MAG: glycosyltransferase family 2 protein, partial [Candidatus Falkowbacteria bacterium]|nr:glycosyltransferase family 2 protein [Candidatus Falkowbacteria bacterium]